MAKPVLYLIACAAGPAQYIDDGVRAAQAAGWDTCLILSPTAVGWWASRVAELGALTGHAVRHRYTVPGESGGLPKADAMLVAPLTTTSACKWAAGITDTVALGIPAEAVHLGVPDSPRRGPGATYANSPPGSTPGRPSECRPSRRPPPAPHKRHWFNR
ncbi:hypothetical protein GCM10009863_10030 [Streptomyces axinellae]|uniref:Flavoprotein domain-containing protein n=1 Tax=Streptomyces axinellae TaxID=552788 RepID=A0ABN3PR65_9ACTN